MLFLFSEKKKLRQMNVLVSFSLASSQSPYQKPTLFLVEYSKYKTIQGYIMTPHTNYPPPISLQKQMFIEHLLRAGPRNTQQDKRLVSTLKALKPTSRAQPTEHQTDSLAPHLRPRHRAWMLWKLSELLEKSVGLEVKKQLGQETPFGSLDTQGCFHFKLLYGWKKNNG